MAEDYRAQVEAVRKQYETYSQRENALAEKLTAAENRSHELEEEIGKLDLKRSPAFQQQYDLPLQQVQDEIAKILVDNGYQQDAAIQAANDIMMADANQVPEMVRELPSVVQGMVMYKHNDADALWARRSQAIDEWRTTQTGLSEVGARADAVQSAQHRADVASAAIDRIRSLAPTMQWDAPEFVKRRDEAIEKAKAWYQTAPEDQIAAAAMEGTLAPFAYERMNALEQEVARLQQQLEASARLRNPTVTPYYPSVPIVLPPRPPTPPGQVPGQPWAAPVDNKTNPMQAAEMAVGNTLGRLFGR